jgi:ATP-binding cassette subfamily B protein
MQHGYGYFEEDKLGEIADIKLWRRILGYTSHHWQGIILAVILSFAVIGSSLLLPYLVRIGVDDYIINTEIPVPERLSGLVILALVFISRSRCLSGPGRISCTGCGNIFTGI